MRRETITPARRRELVLLIASALICLLGFVLECLALHQSPLRALRVATVGGAFIFASFALPARSRQRDGLLLPLASLLSGLSIVLLWGISPKLATQQMMWMVVGLAVMVLVYNLLDETRRLATIKYTAGAAAIALLVLTMVWGQESHGARLWLGIPGLLRFQPGELAKILLAIFLAGYVADKGPIIREQCKARHGVALPGLKYVGPLLLMVVFCLAIFVLQRDLGAAALFFGLFVAVTYLATGRGTYPALAVLFFAGGMYGAMWLFPHVQTRFDAWLNPWADPLKGSYQILQGLFALAGGGVMGMGLGQGAPGVVPEAATDMIFAVTGEQLGLAGCFAILMLYVLMTYRSFSIGWRASNPFNGLLATFLALVFGLQTLVIVGGILRVIPLTGITLPFISYGGTSVAVNFIALGLLLAISRDESGRLA